jgi:FkbM family methyltransferase
MSDFTSPFGTYSLKKREAQLLRWAQGMPATWFGRRAALILRKSVLVNDHTTVDATVDNLKMRLYMKDNVSERKFLFMPQFFDNFERSLLKKELPQGGVFVDIGANAGIYTLTAAAIVGAGGHVLSVEPNPAVLDRLKFNMALNGFERCVQVEQSCVSDAEGTVELTLDDTNLGGSSLVAERSSKKISVSAYPLLHIVSKHRLPRIDALKIDIEGAEDRALIPFFATAPREMFPRILILENSEKQWRQDLKGALEKAGYSLLKATRMNFVYTL